jgi:pimeloyl-ACP methyl ester carboxylesterase
MRFLNILISIFFLILGINISSAFSKTEKIFYRTAKVNGLEIFYREAGSIENPSIILLHGFPTSSHMFRNLIPALADRFHVIAPDYPGFGQSSKPTVSEFKYTFDNISSVVDQLLEQKKIFKYSLYLMDYGAPVGFRIAVKHPNRVQALIVQNGNAYEEGLKDFWNPLRKYWADKSPENAEPLKGFVTLAGVKWQYTHGVKDPERISPDNWSVDLAHLSAPGNLEIQLELFYDYKTNLTLYPSWQEYFNQYQPPMLIVWGKNDVIFPPDGAYPYKRDLRNIDFNILDTGHFALEEKGDFIASKIRSFLGEHLK